MSKEIALMVLAGGMGTRLGLKDKPKPLAIVGDRPILDWTLETLEQLPVQQTVIVVGHMGEKIVQRYNSRENVKFARQGILMGNASAVLFGIDKLSSTVKDILVIQGDDSAFLTKSTLFNLIEKHKEEENISTLLLTKDLNRNLHKHFYATDSRGKIVGRMTISGESFLNRQESYFNTGTLCLNVKFAKAQIPHLVPRRGREIEIPQLVSLALEKELSVGFVEAREGEWLSINTLEGLRIASERMASLLLLDE